jgi:hypothetical protein
MLVIFATRTDPEPRSLAERWAAHDAAVLTCEDLSAAGWRHHLPRRAAGSAVVGGRTIPTAEIAGVLTRWPSVFEQELGQIVAERRAYVASEMTAFLRSWLTELDCPVVNRPSAASLIGPNWRPEQWVHAAAGLGIPVRPVRRLVRLAGAAEPPPAPQEAPYTTVTVVGEAVFGAADPALARHARRLAAAAGVELLAVHWNGPEGDAKLLSADLLPPLGDGAVADALLALLLDRRPRRQAASGGRA